MVLELSAIFLFYNKDFIEAHPNIDARKKLKSVHDFWLLIPTLIDFFKKPMTNPKTFLGDAAFDSAGLYINLLSDNTLGKQKHFSKAYILLNTRASLEKQIIISKLSSGITKLEHVCFLS